MQQTGLGVAAEGVVLEKAELFFFFFLNRTDYFADRRCLAAIRLVQCPSPYFAYKRVLRISG
jgi:hypothetical protein